MAKKIVKKIKLQAPAGKATPAPPIGTALGPAGVNIGEFVTKFNERTKNMGGDIVPVEISVYEDRTFDFILKTPPASRLLLKALGIEKGSGKTPTVKAGVVTKEQLRQIAEKKMPDLNANDMEQAIKIIAGTARSMGIDVK
ncbi:50S ribosomal protein L11 [Candidatus Kaiserbacteria bacterium RIFCSPHIGHO2_02_FULL_50_9]|uniref:Large ribosomal subunit protein uL11 n=1 Tax=Candidatus Kaiserbacteria bacterium RIFCSPLOWO2_01_FULL_51_21 TaxID=1798508 RepID=A0A1F6ED99_9BACT|nr:MAG: 50S ribosomal protein L11 [Candidatus Kaiserbacteria bacterium RIFCSPHIGHO2_01_FULL_51_33]OGG63784.1 MAG: 50S ribosomal protein L11 [Candidatus Kaiserbacteria bacterium RIFCSPHIGHO2_02_FULL_50_9]OGG71616.1 MAG: 50S ribosomal protein L11 [Candidatus Kaiserbacteria bacterium RIFCSPLOWO2_01_FULL_51_21]